MQITSWHDPLTSYRKLADVRAHVENDWLLGGVKLIRNVLQNFKLTGCCQIAGPIIHSDQAVPVHAFPHGLESPVSEKTDKCCFRPAHERVFSAGTELFPIALAGLPAIIVSAGKS